MFNEKNLISVIEQLIKRKMNWIMLGDLWVRNYIFNLFMVKYE